MWEPGGKERDKKKARRSVLFCRLSLLFQAREAEREMGQPLWRGNLGPPKGCVYIRASIHPATSTGSIQSNHKIG